MWEPGPTLTPSPLSPAQDSLVLKLQKELEPGEYSIFLRLTDSQGKAQVTQVKAQVCECEGAAENCQQRAFTATAIVEIRDAIDNIPVFSFTMVPVSPTRAHSGESISPLPLAPHIEVTVPVPPSPG